MKHCGLSPPQAWKRQAAVLPYESCEELEWSRRESRLRSAALVTVYVALSACAMSQPPHAASNREVPVATTSLIDLHTTPLRNAWTQADLDFVMRNERFLAYLDSSIVFFREDESGVGADYHSFFWNHWVAIIWQRRLEFNEDYVDLAAHPRDLDLTLEAYRSLEAHLLAEMEAGRIVRDPSWRSRFPEIYNPARAELPWFQQDVGKE